MLNFIKSRRLTFSVVLGLHVILLGLATDSIASEYAATHSDVSVYTAADSQVDVLNIKRANASGVSFNYFTRFVVRDRPLHIANVPGYESGDGTGHSAASTIVIVSNEITLENQIQSVGPATDIVFLSVSPSGRITCARCVLENFLRVSLITASPLTPLSLDTGTLTDFAVSGNSSIAVNNLYAPGALGLDLVTQTLSSEGEIDLNQKATRDFRGGYTAMPHGNFTIASGGVDIILGPNTWNYNLHQLVDVDPYSAEHVVNGTIRAGSVKISTSGDARINAAIDTRADLLSSTSYKGQSHIPQEGVEIQALAGKNVNLSGSIASDGEVIVRSTGDVISSSSSRIEGETVSVIAQGLIRNMAIVKAEHIALGGGRVFNEGRLIGKRRTEIWGEGDVANQYGGYISADEVMLESANKVVRNGSRTPYRSRDFETGYLLDMEKSELLSASFDPNNFDSSAVDTTELGTFYMMNRSVNVSDASLAMANDSSAHIVANKLEVLAPGFENINPYYEVVDDQTQITLERSRITQVSVSAEQSMDIAASQYILNSSALLLLNRPDGKFRASTSIFINERYRVSSFLVKGEEDDIVLNPEAPDALQSTTDSTSLGTYTAVYSPPGFVMSMGHVEVNATNTFSNIMGYVEFFKTAEIDTLTLKNFGLQNQAIQKDVTETTSIDWGRLYDRPRLSSSTSTEQVLHSPQDLDSLFHVADQLSASASAGWFEVLNPFDYIVNQVIAGVVDENYGHLKDELLREGPTIVGIKLESCSSEALAFVGCAAYEKVYTQNTSITPAANGELNEVATAKQTGEISVEWSQETVNEIYEFESSGEPGEFATSINRPRSGADSYSLFDEMLAYYEKVKGGLVALYDEFKWWD